jgi:hypothetical protein
MLAFDSSNQTRYTLIFIMIYRLIGYEAVSSSLDQDKRFEWDTAFPRVVVPFLLLIIEFAPVPECQ